MILLHPFNGERHEISFQTFHYPKRLQRLESCGKMAELRCFIDDLVSEKFFPVIEHFHNAFNNVIDMALRIHSSRNRKADQFHRRWNMFPLCIVLPEHDAPNLDGANPSHSIQRRDNRLTRILVRRDMGKKSFCINVDCMSARRL